MGRSIGVLGTVHEPFDLEFQYFGTTIRLHPQASDTVELDFLEAGRDIDLSVFDTPVEELEKLPDDEKVAVVRTMEKAVRAGNLLMRDSLRKLIHPDDFAAYWDLAVANGQRIRDLMADLKRLTAAVVEADTGFPTMPPSGSPDGPGATPPRSGDDSSAAVTPASASAPAPEPVQGEVLPREDLPPDLVKALALDRDRPDFQAGYLLDYLQRQAQDQMTQQREARDRERLAAAGIG